jgi:hypothetical protein
VARGADVRAGLRQTAAPGTQGTLAAFNRDERLNELSSINGGAMAKPEQKHLSLTELVLAQKAQDRLRDRTYAPVSQGKSGSNVEEPIIFNPPTAIERWTPKVIEVVVYIMISILLAAIGFVMLAHLMGMS